MAVIRKKAIAVDQKTELNPNVIAREPDTIGPNTLPIKEKLDVTPNAIPRFSSGTERAMIAFALGIKQPIAAPLKKRNNPSHQTFGAKYCAMKKSPARNEPISNTSR